MKWCYCVKKDIYSFQSSFFMYIVYIWITDDVDYTIIYSSWIGKAWKDKYIAPQRCVFRPPMGEMWNEFFEWWERWVFTHTHTQTGRQKSVTKSMKQIINCFSFTKMYHSFTFESFLQSKICNFNIVILLYFCKFYENL